MSASLNNLTSAESRALALLGQGVSPVHAAAASGLSESRISQLLSEEQFASQVAQLRYENLSKHNERDLAYDSLEDQLIEKMKDCLPLMVRPLEILKAISVINAAKRRGTSAAEAITEKQTVINLVLPTQVITQFSLSPQNQVVTISSESSENQAEKQTNLLNIQAGTLLDQVKKKQEAFQLAQGVHDVLSKPAAFLKGAGRTVTAEDF